MAFAPASLSTRVVTIAEAVVPIPPETSFAEAATIPGDLRHRDLRAGASGKARRQESTS